MNQKHYFFDLDGTLVETSQLFAHRKTAQGKKFVANNPLQVPSFDIDIKLQNLITQLNKNGKVSIITNSPLEYARTLLSKHNFPTDLPIFAALNKPNKSRLEEAITSLGVLEQNAMIIGDSPIDIIAAHECGIASIGVSWGEGSVKNLKKAEPLKIVNNYDELLESLKAFNKEEIGYEIRKRPDFYQFLEKDELLVEDPQIDFHNLQAYFPCGHPEFYHSNSNRILTFKESKNFLFKDIQNGKIAQYFHNGQVRDNVKYYDIIKEYFKKLGDMISGNLKGNTLCISTPNSSPEYCFQSDPNQIISYSINTQRLGVEANQARRLLYRVFPREASRISGNRNKDEHYNTIGVKSNATIHQGIENIIIFDDITTSGSQATAIGNILRNKLNFNGNLYGLSIGKTI